jgi:acylphosphatase
MSRRFQIAGKVQGVYFRHSTRAEAQRLGIAGYAENLPDGSVDVLAHGAAEAVEELRRWLHRGPASARVDSVAELALDSERRDGSLRAGSTAGFEIPDRFEVR